EAKAPGYGNWEGSGLDGHIGGHYLSALALMYAADGDEVLLERLEYMLSELGRAQPAHGDGYLGGIPDGDALWQQIASGEIHAENFALNDRWVPLYNIHKLFAGLRDAYRVAGLTEARDMLIALTDWFMAMSSNLSDEQIQTMLQSEHGGLNEVFADVYAITGDESYLDLARRYSHEAILEPLLSGQDELTGLHANTQIPKVIGYQRIGELAGDENLRRAAQFFWTSVVEQRTVAFGGNSVREHFNPVDDFSEMIESVQGPETCNTYNMLRLTTQLFTDAPDGRYIDFYERALYNHILASQHPDGGFVYFTPIRPGHYRVYSQPQTSFWCCVGSGIENHGKYGELIYAHDDTELYVNLFIPSTLDWQEQGLTLTQTTRFPYEEGTRLQLGLDMPGTFAVSIRRPDWIDGEMSVTVNGQAVDAAVNELSYVSIERRWADGDVIAVSLPMTTSAEFLPDGSPWVAFMNGPIVLAAVTDSRRIDDLFADDGRMAHVADGETLPLIEAPALVTDDPDSLAGKLVQTGPMRYSIDSLLYGDRYRGLELVPFFTIHEARYAMYWPVYSAQEMEQRVRELDQ
ncbi:MAG: glycoside hydrolase family 127 protein, partial [Gammaproteobacteria bacterium]